MNIEVILEKLERFFVENAQGDDKLLEIFDEPSLTAKQRGGYTGVTIPYIKKYILEEDVSDISLFFALGVLVEQEKIFMIYCGNVNNLVVENYNNGHARGFGMLNPAINFYVK